MVTLQAAGNGVGSQKVSERDPRVSGLSPMAAGPGKAGRADTPCHSSALYSLTDLPWGDPD